MIPVKFKDDNNVTAKAFVAAVNKARKANKDTWIQAVAIVDGKYVELKAFGTWVQVYRVDDIDYSDAMDILVRDYLVVLNTPFNRPG